MSEFRFDPVAASLQARSYQAECYERVVAALLAEAPKVLLHLATGGGKTFVANNVVANALSDGGYAMWVTKDWWLLRQAAVDMARRHEGMADGLRRLGGDAEAIREVASGERRRWRTRCIYDSADIQESARRRRVAHRLAAAGSVGRVPLGLHGEQRQGPCSSGHRRGGYQYLVLRERRRIRVRSQ